MVCDSLSLVHQLLIISDVRNRIFQQQPFTPSPPFRPKRFFVIKPPTPAASSSTTPHQSHLLSLAGMPGMSLPQAWHVPTQLPSNPMPLNFNLMPFGFIILMEAQMVRTCPPCVPA